MAKRQRKILRDSVRPDPVIATLEPASRWRTIIGPMHVREQRAVAARPPPEEIKQRRIFRPPTSALQPPRRATAFIETQDPPRFFIHVDIVKILRRFRPARHPTLARDQPALMHPIPTFHACFDGDEPGEGK